MNELLALVHLDGLAQRYPSQLSGGQRQRMALARALAVEPKVLLLDEPFGALDAQVRKELRAWLRRLHDEVHVTTIFVTHDQEEAMEVAEQIVVMNTAQVEQTGPPRELYEHPKSEFVMGFVGAVNRLGSLFVRPHDVEILQAPERGADEAMIEHMVHLGFEVRVELVLPRARTCGPRSRRPRASSSSSRKARSSTSGPAGPGCSTARATQRATASLTRRSSRPLLVGPQVGLLAHLFDAGRDPVGDHVGQRDVVQDPRTLFRSAIQTSRNGLAVPLYSSSSGASPRTLASGPSAARITSPIVICSGGRPSQ